MKNVLRVLHVTGVPEGGVINLLFSLHESIDKDAVQFDYIMPESTPFAAASRKAIAMGGRAFKAPALAYGNFLKLNNFFDGFFVEHPEYKIVHVHGPNIAVLCLRNAKKHGVPYRICHSHNTKYADDFIRALRNRLLLINLDSYATDYFACSELAGEFLFNKKNFHILKNGIPTDRFTIDPLAREQIRREFGLDSSFVIGGVGVMRKQKNHAFMLEILRKYRDIYKEGKLLLVGDGELRVDLEHLAEKSGIREHVVFAGMRNDVPALLSAMDAFLMPSCYEGLGIALIEAQASGLPCVYSDVIPGDVQLTDLTRPLSLLKGAEEWAHAIHSMHSLFRRSRTDEIVAAGYDISSSAVELITYYQNLVKGIST